MSENEKQLQELIEGNGGTRCGWCDAYFATFSDYLEHAPSYPPKCLQSPEDKND